MSVVTTKDGQNLIDLTIQQFGTVENYFDVLIANDLSIDSFVTSGQELIIEADGEGDENVKSFYINNNVKPKNNQGTNLPPLIAGAYSNDYSNDYS